MTVSIQPMFDDEYPERITPGTATFSRQFTIGDSKNEAFVQLDAAATTSPPSARISLIGSAKLNGLDPESYLRDVIARIRARAHSR